MKTENALLSNLPAISAVDLVADADGWYQLFPCGHFRARDGRPEELKDGWYIDGAIAERFIASTAAVNQPITFDYDHQTLHKESNGKPAPASGWMPDPLTQMQWRDGKGLYVKPNWTPPAQTAIDNKEYAFLSAVFPYNEFGHPLFLRLAAITNDPGLTGMESLTALAAALPDLTQPNQQQEIDPMNEYWLKLLAALGIEVPEGGEINAELIQDAISKLDALKTASQAAAEVQQAVEQPGDFAIMTDVVTDIVDASADEIKEAEAIIAEAALNGVDLSKGPTWGMYNKLFAQVAALSAQNGKLTAAQVIKDARAKGQIVKEEIPGLLALAKQHGVAALSARIEGRPSIAALTAKQIIPTPTPKTPAMAALTAEDLAVMKATGQTEAEFLKSKEALFK